MRWAGSWRGKAGCRLHGVLWGASSRGGGLGGTSHSRGCGLCGGRLLGLRRCLYRFGWNRPRFGAKFGPGNFVFWRELTWLLVDLYSGFFSVTVNIAFGVFPDINLLSLIIDKIAVGAVGYRPS